MSSAPSSAWVVRVFVYIGMVVTLASAFLAWRLIATRDQELLRYQACQQGTTEDCRPSIFWVLADLVQPDAEGRLPSVVGAAAERTKRVVRTSESAPVLTAVRPEGFTADGAGFRVASGTRVTLTASVEGASRVEARLRLAGSEEEILMQALTAVEGKPDTYSATFVWTEGRAGDLVMFAQGQAEADQTRLLLPLRIEETVANPS